jgi:dolichyl-phosphate beta-glucosyltransferase
MNQKLTIVIPVYNEEKRIGKTLLELVNYLEEKAMKVEVIVVDDGSTDHTAFIVERFRKWVKLIPVVPNRGKGFAIKTGILAASGDLILFMDADLATPLDEIVNFLAGIGEEDEIMIGRRNLDDSKVKRTAFRAFAGLVFKKLSHLLVPVNKIEDTQCGFKLFRKPIALEIFNRAKINRYCFDIEVIYIAQKLGLKIREIPISWEDKPGSTVRMSRDVFVMLKDLFKIRFMDLLGAYNWKEILYKKGSENELFGKTTIEEAKEL